MAVYDDKVAPIQRYARIVRRRAWLVAGFVILVPIVAVLAARAEGNRYQASATVLVSRQNVANQLTGGTDIGTQQQEFQQILTTQAKLARTPTVILKALAAGGSSRLSVDAFQNTSDVQSDPSSDLLTFSVTRPTPTDAKRLADAYAQAYVDYRRQLDSSAIDIALAGLNSALAASHRSSNQALANQLSTSKQELETRLALQADNAKVVASAFDATKVAPRPVLAGILATIVGIAVGLGIALLRETMDTRIRSSAEAEGALDLPVLSRIPKPKGGGQAGSSRLPILISPGGAYAESIRVLRTSLKFGIAAHHARRIMVTSSTLGEGKSTTVANLAVSVALAGQRVVLVELDLRHPRQCAMFAVAPGRGLTDVVLGVDLNDALVEIELPSSPGAAAQTPGALYLLPAGILPPDPSEFLGTEPVRQLLHNLGERFDLVLMDAPPIVGVSDTTVVAQYADALFICVRLGIARRPQLRELGQRLARVDRPILGQIITDAQTDDDQGYGYGYGYGYGHSYGYPGAAVPVDTAATQG